ncbi:hypothetical protein OAC60_02510 [Amylibacter sp.]|nr:hypothetical protein [Amylibacter sp.]
MESGAPHTDLRSSPFKRKPIPNDEIINIRNVCLNIADERLLLIALISDTGMRLSEAEGLVWGGIKIDHQFPQMKTL